jgi:hypothetical protein
MTNKFKLFVVNARLEGKLYLDGKCPTTGSDSSMKRILEKKGLSLKCGEPGNKAFIWHSPMGLVYFIPCREHFPLYKSQGNWKRLMHYDKI